MWFITGCPKKSVERLKTLNCDVIGFYGTQDKFINPELVKKFQEDMRKAGKKLVVKNYDAVHAFANPSNPSYDKIARESAYGQTLAFLKERLK